MYENNNRIHFEILLKLQNLGDFSVQRRVCVLERVQHQFNFLTSLLRRLVEKFALFQYMNIVDPRIMLQEFLFRRIKQSFPVQFKEEPIEIISKIIYLLIVSNRLY